MASHIWGQAKAKRCHWSMEPPRKFKTNIFLQKIPLVSEDLIVIGSGFQIVGTSTEKAHLPIFSLVLGIKSCLKMVDLRVLGMSEKVNFVLTMLHHYAF